jgi:hypothetical protein
MLRRNYFESGCCQTLIRLPAHIDGLPQWRGGITAVADRLSSNQIILKIVNGAVNMPAYAANLTPAQMDALVAFLKTRRIQQQ